MGVEGLDQMDRAFDRFERESRAKIEAELVKGSDEVMVAAKALVPVERGDLRDSGRTVIVPLDGAGVAAEVRFGKGDDSSAHDDAFHASFVEFGTVQRPATPFLFTAYRLLRRRVRGRVGRAVKAAAKAVSK